MTSPDPRQLPDDTAASASADGRPDRQHGDPLLDSAQGRGDGSDASRHGADTGGQDSTA